MTDEQIRSHYRWNKEFSYDYDLIEILSELTLRSVDDIKSVLGLSDVDYCEEEMIRARAKKFQELYDEGYYDKEIAEITGWTSQTVGKWRRNKGLMSRRERDKIARDKKLDEYCEELIVKGYNITKTAELLDVPQWSVSQYIRDNNIELRTNPPYRRTANDRQN